MPTPEEQIHAYARLLDEAVPAVSADEPLMAGAVAVNEPKRSRIRLLAFAASVIIAVGIAGAVVALTRHNPTESQVTTTAPRVGPTSTPTTAAGPSHDDQYVCSTTAAADLSSLLDGRAVTVDNRTLSNGEYTCQYNYVAGANVTVSVKDFATWADASMYFDQRRGHLSDIDTTAVCHDYCYVTRGGLALLRNGSEVLFVDASRLPSTSVGMSRAQNALSVLGAVTPP